ncbi:helix-turn-helix domain-containing protein [Clostridium sp.]|uniref:helix-turn-helix domain-containing protein n=1 Tax=Clostridium sp. TaxID=1506 RepID=UPI002FDE3167
MSVSTNLKKLRTEKGLTQDELSKELNINRATYAHYETGRREPDIETLKLLAKYFNVSLDYLLDGANIRNHDTTYITPKEHENIEEVVEELRERLLNTKNFKIEGKPATKEDIETILDSVKVGIEMAKIKKRRNQE